MHELLCPNYSWDISGNDVFRHDKYLTASPETILKCVGHSVMYFKKCKHSEQLFNTWRIVYNNYEYYSKLFDPKKIPFRNDFALSIAHQLCNGYANKNTFVNSLPS